MAKGLLMINTGNGKGKTTAALGLALRASGHGHRVCFIQFIKGSWKYGEMEALKRFEDLIDFKVMGRGFTWKSEDLEKDKAMARTAWETAREAMTSGRYHLVVLDEFTYVLNYAMVELEEVLAVLKTKPSDLHILITGRDAPAALVSAADLVTDMQVVKHPFDEGVHAQKGVEF
jgi:cob(I)alamin adenosyltransferase